MDTIQADIFNDSRRIITKLQLFSAFFEQETIYKIYLRTQLIHQLFEQNKELDINKLQLFHQQYTASLIDLLKKIKTNNEQQLIVLLDEIQLNQETISRFSAAAETAQTYATAQPQQALKLSASLRKLYEVLSGHAVGYPFSRNIHSFSGRFASDFYAEVTPEIWQQLTTYKAEEVYSNADAMIARKLMGQLCKYDFKCSFFYGIKTGNTPAEIYRLAETDRYFIFHPAQNLLLFLAAEVLEKIDFSNPATNREQLIIELKNKNDLLKSRSLLLKKQLPATISQLLEEHYRKLNEIDFLEPTNAFEAQARILKSMLDTDMI